MGFISVLGNLSLNTITINECKTPLPYRQLQLVHYFICHLPAAQYYLFIYSKDVYYNTCTSTCTCICLSLPVKQSLYNNHITTKTGFYVHVLWIKKINCYHTGLGSYHNPYFLHRYSNTVMLLS